MNPELRDMAARFYGSTIEWLTQDGGPDYQVDKLFLWSMGSWDVLAIDDASTNANGSYKIQDVADMITSYNTQVRGGVGNDPSMLDRLRVVQQPATPSGNVVVAVAETQAPAAATAPAQSSEGSDLSSNMGVIIGAAVGGGGALIIIVFAVGFHVSSKKHRRASSKQRRGTVSNQGGPVLPQHMQAVSRHKTLQGVTDLAPLGAATHLMTPPGRHSPLVDSSAPVKGGTALGQHPAALKDADLVARIDANGYGSTDADSTASQASTEEQQRLSIGRTSDLT